MPVAAPGQAVLGLILEDLSPGSRSHASWGHALTRLVEDFMTNNPAFLSWVSMRSRRDSRFKVTETSLQDFPLEGIRKVLGAGNLDGVTNRHGGLVKPLIDSRIVRKMAAVYKGMDLKVLAKSSRSPPATVAVNHYYQFGESKHPTPELCSEKTSARRRQPQSRRRTTLNDLYLSHSESQSDGDGDEVDDEEEELLRLVREEKIAQRKKAKLVDDLLRLEGDAGEESEEEC